MSKKTAAVLLFAVVVALYLPALRNGFVWDDTALILRDPLIRSWRLIPEGFQQFLFTDATASDFYRPVQRLTYVGDYAAYAFHPAGFHFSSTLWHALAALAFFFFAVELLARFPLSAARKLPTAFCAALFWAIHPAHSAAVVYVSGRADPLAAFFGFFGLFLFLKAQRSAPRKVWLLSIGAAFAFLLSALSKEMGLLFLASAVLIPLAARQWKELLRASVIAIFVAVVYLSLRTPAEHIPPPVSTAHVPALVRPVVTARAFAEYAGLVIFPRHLHMERDVETHPEGFGPASLTAASWRELQTLLGLALIAALLFWLWRSRRKQPAVRLCLLLFIASYIPISGAILLNATIAEHWLYLPTAFLFLAVALTLADLFERRSLAHRKWIAALLAVWAVALGARTVVRIFDWKDQRTFLEHTVAAGGNSARMLINLGGLELSEGHLDAAKKNLEAALQKDPGQPLGILNLAAVAVRQNDFKGAHEAIKHALQSPLVEAKAQELLAVLENKESGTVNLLRLRLASRTGAPDWQIEKRYVKALDQSGYPDRAIAELQGVLKTQWYRAESWLLLAQLLEKTGDHDKAAFALKLANRYDVHLAEVNPPAGRER